MCIFRRSERWVGRWSNTSKQPPHNFSAAAQRKCACLRIIALIVGALLGNSSHPDLLSLTVPTGVKQAQAPQDETKQPWYVQKSFD